VSDLRIKEALDQLQYAENIVNDTQDIKMQGRSDNDEEKVKRCTQYIKELREITSRKLEEITAHLAINAD